MCTVVIDTLAHPRVHIGAPESLCRAFFPSLRSFCLIILGSSSLLHMVPVVLRCVAPELAGSTWALGGTESRRRTGCNGQRMKSKVRHDGIEPLAPRPCSAGKFVPRPSSVPRPTKTSQAELPSGCKRRCLPGNGTTRQGAWLCGSDRGEW